MSFFTPEFESSFTSRFQTDVLDLSDKSVSIRQADACVAGLAVKPEVDLAMLLAELRNFQKT